MADWKDILSDNEEQPENDELMDYINNNLSEEEMHAIEKKTLDSLFVNDALEGLETFDNKERVNQYVQQLNNSLQKQLASKRLRKEKRRLKENPWIIITALILLAICIVGYLLIKMHYIGR